MADTVNGRTGYRDRSASNGARFIRPEGEPSWAAGSAMTLFIITIGIAAAVLLNAAFGG